MTRSRKKLKRLSRAELLELLLQDEEQRAADPELLKQNLETAKTRKQFWRLLRSTISILITVAAISVLIATMCTPVLRISGSSMTPTIQEGELVVCLKTRNFEQGDLIAFYYGNKLLVKRCIAGPGDWVSIDESGNVYVNDELLEEPYLTEKAAGETDLEYPYQVPEDQYFVLGDHRSISMDSRVNQVGCVATEQIAGKMLLRIWPFSRFGSVQ